MTHPFTYIDPNAKVASNVKIDPFTVIHSDVTIGEGTWIGSNVTIMNGTTVGKNCRIFPGAGDRCRSSGFKIQWRKNHSINWGPYHHQRICNHQQRYL